MSEDEATRFTNLFEALIVANGRSATKALFIQAVHLLGLEASVYTEVTPRRMASSYL